MAVISTPTRARIQFVWPSGTSNITVNDIVPNLTPQGARRFADAYFVLQGARHPEAILYITENVLTEEE